MVWIHPPLLTSFPARRRRLCFDRMESRFPTPQPPLSPLPTNVSPNSMKSFERSDHTHFAKNQTKGKKKIKQQYPCPPTVCPLPKTLTLVWIISCKNRGFRQPTSEPISEPTNNTGFNDRARESSRERAWKMTFPFLNDKTPHHSYSSSASPKPKNVGPQIFWGYFFHTTLPLSV